MPLGGGCFVRAAAQLAALVFTLNLSSAISLELFELTSYLMFFAGLLVSVNLI